MKKLTALIGFIIWSAYTWGQAIDTVLTGTQQDTSIARHFLLRSYQYLEEGKLAEAYSYALNAQSIFRSISGVESLGNADATYQIGHIRMDEGKRNLAKVFLFESLDIYIKTIGENNTLTANNYEILGVCYRGINLDSAILFLEKSLKIREQLFDSLDRRLALSYFNLGGAYQSAGDFENAIIQYEKCLKISRENPAAEINGVFYNLGLIYSSKHDLAKARECFQKALQSGLISNNQNDLTRSYLSLSYLETEANNCDLAIQYGLSGLKITADAQFKKDLMEGQIYHALGGANLCKGDFVESEACNLKSFNLLRRALGNNHPFLTTALNSLAICNATGPFHAEEYLLMALDIFQKADLSDSYYYICSNLAENYATRHEVDKAIKYTEIALNGFLKSPDGYQHEIGVVWGNLGNYYAAKGHYAQSLDCYGKAEQAYLQIYTRPNEVFATTYFNIADNYFRQNQFEKADSFLNLSISTLRKTSANNKILNAIFHNWAELEAKKFNYPLALANVDSAILAASNRLGNFNEGLSEAFVKSNLLKGQICLQFYQKLPQVSILKDAMAGFQKAENTLQLCMNSAMRESDKIQLMEYAPVISEGIIRTSLVTSRNSRTAFISSEKSKSGLLRTAFQDAYAKRITNVPDSLLSKEYGLKVNLAFNEKIEYGLTEKDTAQSDGKLIEIRRQIFNLYQQYDQLIQRLETDYPEYYQAKYNLQTETVESVQRDLLQPNQTMLEYFTGDSSIFIFVLRKDFYDVVEVPRDFPLEDWIKSMRSGIADWWTKKIPEDQYSASLSWYGKAAHNLYQKLIAPVARFIPTGDQIIVISDGVLAYIPFEALLTAPPPADSTRFHEYKYWILDHDISYCYSATLLREMCERKHKVKPPNGFLGMAPTFAGNTTPILSSNVDFAGRFGHDSLTFNVVEVDSIQHIWGGQIFTGLDATEKCFADTAWAYRIIHTSLHGEANDRSGDYSFLAFYETPDSIENEWLYVREVYNLTLNADLVTLSACQTGLGELRRGEGIIGLTRAFTYAGAKSIVNTLWSVDDERTMQLMIQFYHNLKTGQQKDVALGNAKRDFIRKGGFWAHPVFWAGFIGIGDMRALD
ncbi:MAG: CHAT domain-containing protein [Phycisphaerae bacterium]|nr:CHAT domain-containing protein [Saprospiraceae bacterium]